MVGVEWCPAGLVSPWYALETQGRRTGCSLCTCPGPGRTPAPSVRRGSSRPRQKTSSTIRCEFWQQPCEQPMAHQTSGTQEHGGTLWRRSPAGQEHEADLPGKRHGSVRDDRNCYLSSCRIAGAPCHVTGAHLPSPCRVENAPRHMGPATASEDGDCGKTSWIDLASNACARGYRLLGL